MVALATTTLLAGCSASAADNGTIAGSTPTSTAATAGLYDDSVVHDIEVTVDPDDYAELVAAY